MNTLRPALRDLVAGAGILVFGAACHAADWRPDGGFVEAGVSRHHTDSALVGVLWAWSWERAYAGGVFTGNTEAFISHWRAQDIGGGHQSFTQVGVVPVVRYRFAEGRSPWFAEAGIGVTMMDRLYRTPQRKFSTTGNFIDVLALGRNIGSDGRHEISLRAVHFSNCHIKEPNPGEEFVQVRYTARF